MNVVKLKLVERDEQGFLGRWKDMEIREPQNFSGIKPVHLYFLFV